MGAASILERGRIFFLGAGFSAGAGLPLTNDLLPLAASLFRSEAPGLFERISWWADNVDVDLGGSPDAEQFARFCTYLDFMELREFAGGERWSSEGSRERVALKFFLAKAIALSTPDPASVPEYYHEFAKGLGPGDIVVTFNWDTLLESLLEHVGTRYSCSFTDTFDPVQVLKMHGSVNWIERPAPWRDKQKDFQYHPLGYGDGKGDREIYSSRILHHSDAWNECRVMTDGVWPLLVLPGYGKAVDARLLAPLWYRPEMLNMRHGGVSIIGLSVANDDYIMDGLFRYLFRSTFAPEMPVTVINPDEGVGPRFQDIAGKELRVRFVCSRFDESSVSAGLLRN